MTAIFPFMFAGTFGFLFKQLCLLWPFLLLGLLFGLAAAYCIWYRTARAIRLEAEAENGRLREGLLVAMRAAPALQKHRQVTQELNQARGEGKVLKTHVRKIGTELERRDRELVKLNAALTKRDEHFRQQQSQLQVVQGNVNSLTGSIKGKESELHALCGELERLTSESDTRESDLRARDKELAALKTHVSEKENALADYQQAATDADTKMKDFQTKIVRLERESSELARAKGESADQLAAAKSEVSKANSDFKTKEAEAQDLAMKLKQRDADMESLGAQAKEAQARQEQMLALKAETAETLKEKDFKVMALQDQLDDSETVRQKQTNDYEEKVKELESALSARQQEIDAAKAKSASAESALAKQEQDAEAKSMAITDLKQQMSDLQRAKEAAESQLGGLRADVTSKEQELLGFHSAKQAKEEDITQFLNEMEDLEGKLAEREQSLKNAGEQVTAKNDALAQANKSLLEKNEEIERLKAEIEGGNGKQAEIDPLQQSFAEIERANAESARRSAVPAALGLASFAGEDIKEDQKLGVVYRSRPDEVDDLKKISGVANVLEGKLHHFGVYRFKQVALWKPEQEEEFGNQLSFRDRIQRDQWRAQASQLHLEKYGEDLGIPYVISSTSDDRSDAVLVKEHQTLGLVYVDRPRNIDDLTRIKGVGNVLEKKLHGFGIYRFKQISAWTTDQVNAFSEQLDFKGRIEREEWIRQARELNLANN